jgi:hypothetical protein
MLASFGLKVRVTIGVLYKAKCRVVHLSPALVLKRVVVKRRPEGSKARRP